MNLNKTADYLSILWRDLSDKSERLMIGSLTLFPGNLLYVNVWQFVLMNSYEMDSYIVYT